MRRSSSKLVLQRAALGFALLMTAFSCADTSANRLGKDTQKEDIPKEDMGNRITRSTKGIHSYNLSVDGTKREFSYFIPNDADSKRLPIVIYLHGHGDSMRHMLGKGFVKSASSKWMDVANREGFMVMYPLGLKGTGRRPKTGWNDCRGDASGNPRGDDIKFIRELIDFAVNEKNGDRNRVYVTGMSNGGHMTMRVAMEMSSEVAAVAPIVALLPRSNKCQKPANPVPILMMHGTADPIAPFEGGSMAGGRGEVMSARETANTWVRWNRLENVPERTLGVQDKTSSDNSRIVTRVREASPGGNAVIAYEIQGAGHTEPSRSAKMNRLLKRVQGNQNNDIEMAETIWDFFKTRNR